MPQLSFSPLAGSAPLVATLPASAVTVSTAQLNATVNPGNLDTAWHFEYGPTTNYGNFSATNALVAGTNSVAINSALAGLVAAALYHYRGVVSNSAGLAFGQDMTFSTLAMPRPHLAAPTVLADGAFQFVFDNPYDVDFTVRATTNLAAPTALWPAVGTPAPIGDGLYQFTDSDATNHPRRFYLLRSP
jgi:hypothetical protein